MHVLLTGFTQMSGSHLKGSDNAGRQGRSGCCMSRVTRNGWRHASICAHARAASKRGALWLVLIAGLLRLGRDRSNLLFTPCTLPGRAPSALTRAYAGGPWQEELTGSLPSSLPGTLPGSLSSKEEPRLHFQPHDVFIRIYKYTHTV